MNLPAISAGTETLDAGLRSRQNNVRRAQEILKKTAELFEQFGGDALKTTHARFAELARSLESESKVLLVVVGEFSRGKSSLVNALLGIELLRYAKEATTAINTFISALPEGRSERFIRVHFIDQRPPLEMPWTDPAVLERWSTELDSSNADVRREVDRIEIFMSHPLLDHGLVLIDTPGLESLVPHHEEITRRAIAEAHIALWILSAGQLGGNRTEWQFMSDTICRNFGKFITVVNMWDLVLESKDTQDIGKPESQLAEEALAKVRRNFDRFFSAQSDDDLATMTDGEHLMGVSAAWAMDADPNRQRRSGIATLAGRIGKLFSSGEALEQIYRKPLKQLSHIQQQLQQRVAEEIEQLAAGRSDADRARELALLDEEIKNLELEMRTVANESALEHDRVAKYMAAEVESQLVLPLADLKAEIELHVTAGYIEAQVEKKVRKIGLPPKLAKAFDDVTARVEQDWEAQKRALTESLNGLRIDYAERMARHSTQLNDKLGAVEISLPKLDVGFDLDLGPIEEHHARVAEMERAMVAAEEEVVRLEQQQREHASDTTALKMAEAALRRAEQAVERVGPQPPPRIGKRMEKYADGGMYSSDKYAETEVLDYSNVELWREQMAAQQSILEDKASRVEEIMAEEYRKNGIRISLEAAQRRHEKEVANFTRKMQQEAQKQQRAQQNLVEDMLAKLIAGTAGQLQQRIAYLKGHIAVAIQQIYSNQLELLRECVNEQFLEPLNDKRAQREAVQQLLQQGQLEVSRRKQVLAGAQEEIAGLVTLTLDALH
jgi:predicted GTPase